MAVILGGDGFPSKDEGMTAQPETVRRGIVYELRLLVENYRAVRRHQRDCQE